MDQAKSLKFLICKYNDLDIMNSKFVKIISTPLEMTYISPFAVLFFRNVLIASTDYFKLFLVSLPLRHIRCLLYVNISFYILFSLCRLVKVLFCIHLFHFCNLVYCITIKAFQRCIQRSKISLEKIHFGALCGCNVPEQGYF